MGILNKLTTEGSAFTAYNGATPQVNPLATQQSKLHADGDAPGYSLDGAFASAVAAQSNDYLDGVTNPLPLPSQLDLNGVAPVKYLDNLPE
jgi:hypothetical protein